MRKIIGGVLLFIGLILWISACSPSSRKKEKSKSENIRQQIFLIGNGPNSKKTIKDMIKKSGIRKGGYVVIVPMSENKQDSSAFFLQKEFYEQRIMAVHVLHFYSGSSLKNTDVLAIENASILCLLDGNRNKSMKLTNNARLNKSLLKALENGSLIAGIGDGASILGSSYYQQIPDPGSKSSRVVLKPGLGLLKNTVIDDIDFLRNYREGIMENSANKKFVFIGLGYKSAVWIKNEDAVVLGKPEIGLVLPDDTIKMLGKGDGFSIAIK